MNNQREVRYASSPREVKSMNTEELRNAFLIKNIMTQDAINLVYSHYDRFITGGVVPVNTSISLESIDALKSENFLDRRELGIINIGNEGTVTVDGTSYALGSKEAL